MSKDNKLVFKAMIDEKEVELAVIRPTSSILRNAQIEYNKTFALLLKNGGILKETLDSYMRDQKLWDDQKEKQYTELLQNLSEGQNKLESEGGIKLSEAKQIALNMRKWRLELIRLLSEKANMTMHTVEGQSEDYRFNYLVSCCLVYNDTGACVFKDIDDYLNKSQEPYAVEGATLLASLIHGYNINIDASFAENKFLKTYGFVDDKLRLINKDNQLIDEDGRLIDEEGYFIDSKGNRVYKDGTPVVVFKPFLDDDGNPVEIK